MLSSTAGGLPSPDYFPFEEISAQVLLPNTFKTTSVSSLSWLWTLFGRTNTITIPKYVPNATLTTIQLSTSLQYGTALGLPALQKFVREFVEKVFTPGYGNWETILNGTSIVSPLRTVLTSISLDSWIDRRVEQDLHDIDGARRWCTL